jgi:hypothetical protein
MKNRFYLFAILLPIFLLANCGPQIPILSGTKQTEESKAVKSTLVSSVTLSLTTEPTTIYKNSVFTLTATVTNPGTEVASNARIKATRESGDFILDESEKLLGNLEPQPKGKTVTYRQSWSVTAGERSGSIAVRVKYDYVTKAGGDIVIYDLEKVNRDEKLRSEAQASPGILAFEGSSSPLKISLTDNGPFYYSPTHTTDRIFFSVENGGNGIVSDMKIRATIKIGNKFCKNNEVINLEAAGTANIECSFDLAKPSDYKTTIPFSIEIGYTYETSASKSISITK